MDSMYYYSVPAIRSDRGLYTDVNMQEQNPTECFRAASEMECPVKAEILDGVKGGQGVVQLWRGPPLAPAEVPTD